MQKEDVKLGKIPLSKNNIC